jgi:hypothetical protein
MIHPVGEAAMGEFLHQYGFWLIILAPAILGAIGAFLLKIAGEWRKARATDSEAILKQEMVQRGMTAEEIVRVLQAGQSGASDTVRLGVGELMAEKAYQAADIVQVVNAWPSLPPSVQATVRTMVENEYSAAEIKKVLDGCQVREGSLSDGQQPSSLHDTAAYHR